MSLVDSLLGAIIKLEGDSLVLHTGEKPYVVTSSSSLHAFRGPLAWGQVELSTRTLTAPAVMSILEQLLDREQLHALDEMGAIEHYLPKLHDRPSFQVVAARGGDDIWVEIRPVRPPVVPQLAADNAASSVVAPAGSGRDEHEAAAPGAHIEVVAEVEQEQPDADAVAALLSASGLATAGGPGARSTRDAEGDARAQVRARAEEEERRLAAAREEASRVEAGAREEAERLAALREEAARLESAKQEAGRAAAAAREDAARVTAEARAAAEALEHASRDEAVRLQAAREELARVQEARDAAVRAEEARLEALREEALLAEAAAAEEQARVEALRQEAARLEAARAEAARAEAVAREEAARVEALRVEAVRLDAVRAEAAAVEAAARQEAARLEKLREEAERLESARAEAGRVEAAARAEAERLAELRRETQRLEGVRAEVAAVEAAAREEEARIAALREEAARLEAAREDAARVEAARIDALRQEAAQLEAARAEAARVEADARQEAARVAETIQAQSETLARAQEEIAALRSAIQLETERLEDARSTTLAADEARQRAEREDHARVEALREAQRQEESRLEELRAQAAQLEAARREEQAAAEPDREAARPLDVARRSGEERLAALLAALRDDTASHGTRADTQWLGLDPHPDERRPLALPPGDITPAPAGHQADATGTEPGSFAAPLEPEPSVASGPAPLAAVEPVPAAAAEAGSSPAGPVEPYRDAAEPEARFAQVVPLVRGVREQPTVSAPVAAAPDLDRLLRIAAARGASGLYLVSRSLPAVRVDGDMQALESEEPLASADVEAFMMALVPEPSRDSVKSGATVEWFCDVPEIGRVRCLSFRDHRGPGVIVRMLPARAASAEQLGLSREIQALSTQPDGLVLITGPRASGKSTMLAAFVDLINRTRADHVITIERQVTVVHQSQRAFVSQREVRGEAHDVLTAVRAALREDPDVLVVEELRSPEVVAAALESAESGRLVIAGLRAPASAQAIERLINQVPADRRAEALSALATSLRGVVSQVLLRRRTGGRIAARELLLNTPAAAAVLAEGKLFQLGAALESGRKLGSVPLNDSLVALIRDGIVDPGEAWRKAYDREGLLTLLKREGIDTSFVEKLA